jgi:GNAT superfamily N-acetyltransferase
VSQVRADGAGLSMSPEVFIADSDADIDACFPAYEALRPHLKRAGFIAQIRRQQLQSFQLLALRHDHVIKSAAGFRLAEFTAWGKLLYLDDLTTLPEYRSQGHATVLLDWLLVHARERRCDAIHLDSGYARHAAHRLYLNKGFVLASHHLKLDLEY